MVSSRWVAGSSTGTREFSVSSTIKSATMTSSKRAPAGPVRLIGIAPVKYSPKLSASGHPIEEDQDGKNRGFGQGAEKGLTGSAHALKGRSGVEGGGDGKKSSRGQNIKQHQNIAMKGDQRSNSTPGEKTTES